MNCENVREELSAYLDGMLDPAVADAVRAHLDSCGDCRRELMELQETVDLLHGLEKVEVPVDLVQGVRTQIARAEAAPARSAWFSFLATPQFRAAAAACFVIGLCAYGLRYVERPRVVETKSDRVVASEKEQLKSGARPDACPQPQVAQAAKAQLAEEPVPVPAEKKSKQLPGAGSFEQKKAEELPGPEERRAKDVVVNAPRPEPVSVEVRPSQSAKVMAPADEYEIGTKVPASAVTDESESKNDAVHERLRQDTDAALAARPEVAAGEMADKEVVSKRVTVAYAARSGRGTDRKASAVGEGFGDVAGQAGPSMEGAQAAAVDTAVDKPRDVVAKTRNEAKADNSFRAAEDTHTGQLKEGGRADSVYRRRYAGDDKPSVISLVTSTNTSVVLALLDTFAVNEAGGGSRPASTVARMNVLKAEADETGVLDRLIWIKVGDQARLMAELGKLGSVTGQPYPHESAEGSTAGKEAQRESRSMLIRVEIHKR